jgi:hypothetical protein
MKDEKSERLWFWVNQAEPNQAMDQVEPEQLVNLKRLKFGLESN